MIHVFVLMIYLGEGQLISGDMMFRDVTECNYFAKESERHTATINTTPKFRWSKGEPPIAFPGWSMLLNTKVY